MTAPSGPNHRGPRPASRRRALVGWGSVGLSVALVVACVGLVDARQVLAQLASLDARWLAVAFLLGLAQLGLLGLRWSRVARELGLELGWLEATWEYSLSVLGNQVLPTGVAGDGLRGVRHSRASQAPAGLVFEALALDRISGQLALWLVVLLTLPLTLTAGLIEPQSLAIAAAAGGATLCSVWALGTWSKRRGRLAGRLFERLARSSQLLLDPRRASVHLPSSLLLVALTLLQLYVAGRSIGVSLPMGQLGWLGPLILVASSVPSFFGGWGIRESASAMLFASAGLASSTGVAVSIVYGTFSLVISIPAVGVLFLAARARPRTSDLARAASPERTAEQLAVDP